MLTLKSPAARFALSKRISGFLFYIDSVRVLWTLKVYSVVEIFLKYANCDKAVKDLNDQRQSITVLKNVRTKINILFEILHNKYGHVTLIVECSIINV